MRRSITVTALTAAVIGCGATPALAHGGDGDDGFAPVDPAFYETFSFEACDDTITVVSGDVRELETRETVDGDVTVVEFRGDFTVDLIRESDGAMIDELDISGYGREEYRPDGATILLEAPSILFPVSDVQRDAIEEAGLDSDLLYLKRGEVTIEIEFDEDGAAVDEDWDVDGAIKDLCQWFDGGHADREH